MDKEKEQIEYTRTFTKEECELFGCDPVEWVNGAIEGKLNKCRKRLIKKTLEQEPIELLRLCQEIRQREVKLLEDKTDGRTETSI